MSTTNSDPGQPYNPDDFYLNGYIDEVALDTHAAYAHEHLNSPGTDPKAPIFYGSYDWHSSVHAHLAIVNDFIAAGDIDGLNAFVAERFTTEKIQGEIKYNVNDPYGWAWLLQLDLRLREQGITAIQPLAEFFAPKLLDVAVKNASTAYRYGSHPDANWMFVNLYQWAERMGQEDLAAKAVENFLKYESKQGITVNTLISDGDFFSKVGILAYTHVVMDLAEGAAYQQIHDIMFQAASNGSLKELLNTTGVKLDSGVGFDHFAGIVLSAAFGYWALFEETGNVRFGRAYADIIQFAEDHAIGLGTGLGAGHWLPNFAAFATALPDELVATALKAIVLDGGNGDETFVGDFTNDTLSGNGGNDILQGNGGDDTLSGGDGNDQLFGEVGRPKGAIVVGENGTQIVAKDAGNNTQATAIDLTGYFSLSADSNIADATTIPHASVKSSGNGTQAFYKLTLAAGSTLVVDIDGAMPGFDGYIYILDAKGNVIASNDDRGSVDPGSAHSWDPGFSIPIAASGEYTIKVSQRIDNGIPIDKPYVLNVSVKEPTAPTSYGVAGNDLLDGGAGDDTLDGGGGNDRLIGGIGNDTVLGGLGDDAIVALADDGSDTYDGGEGADTIDISATGKAIDLVLLDGVTTYDGDTLVNIENVIGGGGNDRITGNSSDNVITGGSGNDTLSGGAGNDTFIATANDGNDTYDGGDGNDIVDFSVTSQNIVFTSGRKTTIGNDTLISIENIIAGSGNDILTGDASDNTLYGNGGNDSIDGREGNNVLDGGEGNNVLKAGAGNDSISAGSGNDSITAGDGNNTVDAGNGNNAISAGSGNDVLRGGTGNDSISAGAGDDVLYDGGGGNDVLDASAGNDILHVGAGNDSASGGGGNDRFVIDALGGNDSYSGGDGTDTIDFSAITQGLTINLQNGTVGTSSLSGFETVIGGSGNDVITGNGSANTLIGGAGDDTLTGGGGADQFVFTTAAGIDTIKDFAVTGNAQDTLVFDDALFSGFAGASAADLIASGYLRAVAGAATTEIQIDADGGGDAFTTLAIVNGKITDSTLAAHTAINYDLIV